MKDYSDRELLALYDEVLQRTLKDISAKDNDVTRDIAVGLAVALRALHLFFPHLRKGVDKK